MNYIVAVDEKWGIGKNNDLLFSLKGDMAFFVRDNGQYVMHRICKVDKNGDCFFVGDAQLPSRLYKVVTTCALVMLPVGLNKPLFPDMMPLSYTY